MMEKLKWIGEKKMKVVRELDLMTYFQNYEPDELIRKGYNDYITKKHSSLHLSNGLWCYFSGSKGGRSAYDYLVDVENWDRIKAGHYLYNLIMENPPIKVKQPKKRNYPFRLPDRNENENKVLEYLVNERCIDREIVQYCIENHLIYEAKKDHAVVFVGYDKNHHPTNAAKRSTNSSFKMDVAGSNKENSFNIINDTSKVLHVFESAIDLLSYLTLLKRQGREFLNDNYLSIAGASFIGKKIEETKIPVALEKFLQCNPNLNTIRLYLDNDKAGKQTTTKIIYHLNDKYRIFDHTPYRVKDMNELLQKSVKSELYIKER